METVVGEDDGRITEEVTETYSAALWWFVSSLSYMQDRKPGDAG